MITSGNGASVVSGAASRTAWPCSVAVIAGIARDGAVVAARLLAGGQRGGIPDLERQRPVVARGRTALFRVQDVRPVLVGRLERAHADGVLAVGGELRRRRRHGVDAVRLRERAARRARSGRTTRTSTRRNISDLQRMDVRALMLASAVRQPQRGADGEKEGGREEGAEAGRRPDGRRPDEGRKAEGRRPQGRRRRSTRCSRRSRARPGATSATCSSRSDAPARRA